MQALPTLLRAALGLLFLALPAPAQLQHARASLYTKAEEGMLLSALEIKVEPGWYLYHADKGPGTGQSTALTLGGEGLEWGEPRWPAPHRHDQEAMGEEPATFVWVHTGTVVVYAAARLADKDSAAHAVAALAGQTCVDGPFGVCAPYAEDGLTSLGEGSPDLWKAFPREVIPAPADVHKAGEADATLYARVRDGRVLAALALEIKDGWHLFHTDAGTDLALPLTLELKGDGIALTRAGTSESSTKGTAIVSPKTAMPSATRPVEPPLAPIESSVPTKGAVHVNEVTTRVAPMRKTPRYPPVIDARPARFIRAGGGSRLTRPKSDRAKSTKKPAMTRFVTGCVAKGMMAAPTTTPMAMKISTMPRP